MCGMLFIIPAPLTAPLTAPMEAAPEPPQLQFETPAPPEPTEPESSAAPVVVDPESVQPELLHIPCPEGHELEVPRDMLGQFVACPHCQAQWTLKERDSVEWKTKRAAEQERRWERAGQAWLNWAIIIAVVVVIGLIVLIASGT